MQPSAIRGIQLDAIRGNRGYSEALRVEQKQPGLSLSQTLITSDDS